MTSDTDKLTDARRLCTQSTQLINAHAMPNKYGTIKVSDLTNITSTTISPMSGGEKRISNVGKRYYDQVSETDEKNMDIVHTDIKGFLNRACMELKYYYGLSRIVESPSVSVETLIKAIDKKFKIQKEDQSFKTEVIELAGVCVNANLFAPTIFNRDIDVVNMIIEIINESYFLGRNMVHMNPEIAQLSDDMLIQRLTDTEHEERLIAQITNWSHPMSEVFRLFVIYRIKKEIVCGIRGN